MTSSRAWTSFIALTLVMFAVVLSLASCNDSAKEPYRDDVVAPNMIFLPDLVRRVHPFRPEIIERKVTKRSTVPLRKTARRR